MYKICLILIVFSINSFAQMLSLEDRYKQLYKNFKKTEYQKEVIKSLTKMLENRFVVDKSEKILNDSYENKVLKSKIVVLFINVIYDNKHSLIIKNQLSDLLFKDEEFKTSIIKIIKTEKDTKKIFSLLKEFFIKKLDKRFNDVFKRYLKDKFLCQHNIDLTFSMLAESLLSKEIEDIVLAHYKENEFPEKYAELLKRKIVAMPYNYSIDNWFEKNYKKILLKLNDYFVKNESKFLVNDKMESVELDIIYSLLQNEVFLTEFKKEFYNEFLKDENIMKSILKDSLISDTETLFNKIKEKRFNCFHLNRKMFRIDKGVLSFYFKDVLKAKEIEKSILPILFKSLK